MPTDIDRERIKLIKSMLFEMAAGNFSFKIRPSGADDELDGLCVLVNMLAEELRAAVFHSGYVNPRQQYCLFVQSTFVLDQYLNIISFNQNASSVLQVEAASILGMPFEGVLSEAAAALWRKNAGRILSDEHFHENIALQFISEKQLPTPSFCTVSRLLHSSKILISSVTFAIDPGGTITPNDVKGLFSADARLMQELYDYILSHLEEPLPSLQELSRIFGTNEVKLKEGFRHFFKTSIYQFYNHERLKRAKLLIEQTELPLKTVAYSCGFGTYPNFSKAFRKKFGVSPLSLRQP